VLFPKGDPLRTARTRRQESALIAHGLPSAGFS
jgi:hypothetical protein